MRLFTLLSAVFALIVGAGLHSPVFAQAQDAPRPLPRLEQPFDQAAFDKMFQHHFTEINGLTIHYVMGGEGPPLVLLHGWPETSYSFRQIMPALGEHFTLIVPDLRGFGDSDKPESVDMTKPQMADDVVTLIEQLGYDQVQMVGHDWGGVVAYEIAWRRPDLVSRLAFFEMVLPGFTLDDPAFVAGFWQFGMHRARDVAELLTTGKEEEYFRWMIRSPNIYNRRAFTEADIREYMRTYGEPGGFRTSFQLYRTADEDGERYKQWAAERLLDMPVLALGGETSMRGWTEKDMREVASNVTGGIVPQFGHLIEENPQGVIDALLPFLLEGRDAP